MKKAEQLASYLLELNVLNVQDIERHLKILASRAYHPQVGKWLMTVARNYILNHEEGLGSDLHSSEYVDYKAKVGKKDWHPSPGADKLPPWAAKSLADKRPLHVFNPRQTRRRKIWQDLDKIIDWFNEIPATDPTLNRIDRISFDQALKSATELYTFANENPMHRMKGGKKVFREYSDGFRWVQLTDPRELEVEGESMGHCVKNQNYQDELQDGESDFFSLRDKQNNPHITVQAERASGVGGAVQHNIRQMKGRQNAKPIDKYQPYLADFVNVTGWPVTGDQRFVDMDALNRVPPQRAPEKAAA